MRPARVPSFALRRAAILALLALFATVASAAWLADGTPVVTLTPSSQLRPGIIPRTNGAWIAWSDTRNGAEDIYHRRVDSTGVLGTEFLLALDASFQNGPRGVPDGGNGAIIAWMDARSGNYDIYADRISSSGFPQWVPGDGKPVVAAAGHQRFHAVQADGLISFSTLPARTSRGRTTEPAPPTSTPSTSPPPACCGPRKWRCARRPGHRPTSCSHPTA